ncbi:phospholipase-like protein [Tanacetum coccineum]
MTIVEYMEYEAEMRRDPRRYTRNSGLTTPRETKSLENMHQPAKLKTNNYFPSIPTCFEPAQLHTDDIHEPLGNKPNDYHLFTPQSHYETKEVSSDEDVDEWLNEELSKRMTGEDKEEEEDALIDILKTMVEECKSVYKKAQIRTPSSGTSKIQGISFVAEEEEGDSSETLPSNEINPGSFTIPCTIGNLKIYVMADVGAGINMMPKSLFEHLKLANLKKTSMAIEIDNMTEKAPLGIVENILVKIDKFLFHYDFVVIDMLEEPDKTILLGRPFFAMIHAQIDVFRGEILLGVGNEKESEYVNPHEIENDDSPALEQRTFHYNEESVDTVDSSSDSQENEVESHLSENVSRWHVCKPVHITFKVCEEDCGIMRDRMTRGNGMKFDDFLSVRTTKYTNPYDLHHKNDSPPNETLRINTYFPDVSQIQPKSRIRENSFEEWIKIKLGHTNISDSMRRVMFKEWVKEYFGVNIGRTMDDPYSRNFDVYKDEFDKEIEHLVIEYELKVGRKRYALEEVWKKCETFHDSTKQWYDEGFEEDELWENGIEEIDYTPLLAKNENFEVHRYTFKNRKSFISITKQMTDVQPLGRVNGSRFIEKTMNEIDEKGGATRKT